MSTSIKHSIKNENKIGESGELVKNDNSSGTQEGELVRSNE